MSSFKYFNECGQWIDSFLFHFSQKHFPEDRSIQIYFPTNFSIQYFLSPPHVPLCYLLSIIYQFTTIIHQQSRKVTDHTLQSRLKGDATCRQNTTPQIRALRELSYFIAVRRGAGKQPCHVIHVKTLMILFYR